MIKWLPECLFPDDPIAQIQWHAKERSKIEGKWTQILIDKAYDEAVAKLNQKSRKYGNPKGVYLPICAEGVRSDRLEDAGQ